MLPNFTTRVVIPPSRASLQMEYEVTKRKVKYQLIEKVNEYFAAKINSVKMSIQVSSKIQELERQKRDLTSLIYHDIRPIFPHSFPADFRIRNAPLINRFIAMRPATVHSQNHGTIRCATQVMIERRRAVAMNDPIQRQALTDPFLRATAVGGLGVTAVAVSGSLFTAERTYSGIKSAANAAGQISEGGLENWDVLETVAAGLPLTRGAGIGVSAVYLKPFNKKDDVIGVKSAEEIIKGAVTSIIFDEIGNRILNNVPSSASQSLKNFLEFDINYRSVRWGAEFENRIDSLQERWNK
jgi:hypothetical protein